eukprot:1987123-Prymnesium_polylepis.2
MATTLMGRPVMAAARVFDFNSTSFRHRTIRRLRLISAFCSNTSTCHLQLSVASQLSVLLEHFNLLDELVTSSPTGDT